MRTRMSIKGLGMSIVTGLLFCAGRANAQRVPPAAAYAQASQGWTAYRLDDQEKGLRALADRAFVKGRRYDDGSGFELWKTIEAGPKGGSQASGSRSAVVLGEPGPGGAFRPRTMVVRCELDEPLPGGGQRSREWVAVVDLDGEGVRVHYEGRLSRPDGAMAPDLDGDPRDEDGWGKALDDLLAAWSMEGGKRGFFDPWF